jgi:hypothetical protein
MQTRTKRLRLSGFLAALLFVGITGCGKETVHSNPPTATAVAPSPGAIDVPVNQAISASFNEAMNPATINQTTFTLSGAGGAVGGTVSYNASGSLVSFVPSSNLQYNTVYTASISTGAANTLGLPISSPYTWTFTTAVQPTVLSSAPANGATGVPLNQVLSVTFSKAVNCATLVSPATSFRVSGPGAAVVAGTVTCSGSVATFTPSNPLAANTTFSALITTAVTDVAGDPLAATYAWRFKTTSASGPLSVISTEPTNGATGVAINKAVTASFSQAMNAATLTTTTFTLATGTTAVSGTVTYVAPGSTAIFTPAAALTPKTVYTATITTGAMDSAGGSLAAPYVWRFTTAAAPTATAPTVVQTVPLNNATAVPLNQVLVATFNKAINASTVNGATFTLAGPGTTGVTGLVAYSSVGDTATFTPSANLLPSTLYTATITTGVKDLSGNALAANYVWTFTTGTALNIINPEIVSTNPMNNATNVPSNQAVSATFSEPMDPLTITTNTFQLSGPGSMPVAGTVSYDPVSFIATFTPSAPLNGAYVATITSGVTDLFGNSLGTTGAANPWMFSTGTNIALPPVVLGPTISAFGGFGGGAGMTNQGIYTVINGDIGTTGASTTMTGFYDKSVPAVAGVYPCSYTVTGSNMGLVNGAIETAPPPPSGACSSEGTATTFDLATQAALEARTAYTTLQNIPPGITLATNELGNRVLAPGVYTSSSFYQITTGPLTLDAQGDPNASWVFQMGSYLTVGTPTASQSVLLANGAQAKNVFWAVGGLPGAVINYGGGGTMVGTIISQPGITVSSPGVAAVTTINGRLLALDASTTLVNTVINVPAK